MFFLARSAVCITLVVSALPDRHPGSAAELAPARLAAAVGQDTMDRFCRGEPARCLDALARVAAVSHDTLNAADRTTRWVGPALVATR